MACQTVLQLAQDQAPRMAHPSDPELAPATAPHLESPKAARKARLTACQTVRPLAQDQVLRMAHPSDPELAPVTAPRLELSLIHI